MDTRLLAGAHPDDLAIERQTNRVGLRVLQRNHGNDEIALRLIGKFALSCDELAQRIESGKEVIAFLLEAHAEDLSGLRRWRLIIRIDLKDGVPPTLLLAEDGERSVVIA